MKREKSFKKFSQALDSVAKGQKTCMIIWFVSAGVMLGIAIFGAVIGQWSNAFLDLLLTVTYVYVAMLHRSRIRDIGMLKESVEFIDEIDKIFVEAVEAADKEPKNDVIVVPTKEE